MSDPKSRLEYWISKEQRKSYYSWSEKLINALSIIVAVVMGLADIISDAPPFQPQTIIVTSASVWMLLMVILFACVDDNAKNNFKLWKADNQ